MKFLFMCMIKYWHTVCVSKYMYTHDSIKAVSSSMTEDEGCSTLTSHHLVLNPPRPSALQEATDGSVCDLRRPSRDTSTSTKHHKAAAFTYDVSSQAQQATKLHRQRQQSNHLPLLKQRRRQIGAKSGNKA